MKLGEVRTERGREGGMEKGRGSRSYEKSSRERETQI